MQIPFTLSHSLVVDERKLFLLHMQLPDLGAIKNKHNAIPFAWVHPAMRYLAAVVHGISRPQCVLFLPKKKDNFSLDDIDDFFPVMGEWDFSSLARGIDEESGLDITVTLSDQRLTVSRRLVNF